MVCVSQDEKIVLDTEVYVLNAMLVVRSFSIVV